MRKAEKHIRAALVITAEAAACSTIISLLRSVDHERLLLAFGTLLLVLIPELVERLFKCRIHIAVYVFAVIYALGPMMGHCWLFYYTIPCWDKLLHLCGGVMFVILGAFFSGLLSRDSTNHISSAVFALCFSMSISVVWEFVEYGADLFLGMDMQDDTVVTALTSYLLGTESGITGSIDHINTVIVNGRALPVEGYIDVGLHDTMQDMLLETAGALGAFVILLADKGKHNLIKACPKRSS